MILAADAGRLGLPRPVRLVIALAIPIASSCQTGSRQVWRWDPSIIAAAYPGTATATTVGQPNAIQPGGALELGRSPVGEALLFDGQTGALRGQPLPELRPGNDIGITCWLRLDALP